MPFNRIIDVLRNPVISRIATLCAAAINGAASMTVWFFVSSAAPPDQLLIADAQLLAEERLNELGVIEAGTKPNFVSTDAISTGMSSQVMALWGRYRLRNKLKNIDPLDETSLFLAIAEDGPKTLLTTVLGRQPPKLLTAILTFDASSHDAMISNLRAEDVLDIGSKQIAFDIVEFYADAVGGSPITLQKNGSTWVPILVRDYTEEIRQAIFKSHQDNSVRYSKSNEDNLFADIGRGVVVEKPIFGDRWSIHFNGSVYDVLSIRNSPATSMLRHPETRKPSLIIGQSLFDDCAGCDHHVFVKALSLKNSNGQWEWINDPGWNGGHGLITVEAVDAANFLLNDTFYAGFEMGKEHL